ncbi:MAG TPA: pitrilysin family protein [Longimicrobiales bacterium]|nr:pitrilysin family protein [Longimicrobiales bacterium]
MSGIDRTRVPEPGEVVAFEFPAVQRRGLDNGLALLTARHGQFPLVTAVLVLDAGAAGEPADKAGLAHLTANALEAGTRSRSGEELAWALERLGVEFTAEASWDAVSLAITVPRQRLEPALELFAEIVRQPAFPEDEIARLRDEQLASILQRQKEPRALANDMAARFIFDPDVPYARPLIGLQTSVAGLTRDDVDAYYRANFQPAGGTLIMVGDIDPDAAAALAERHFGDWAAAPRRAVDFHVRRRVEKTTIFVVDRPDAVQSEIRIGDVGVPRHHEDYFPLLVMNCILGGAFTSRLNLSLRERHGFTYGARSGFAFRRQPGPFIIQVAVATDVTAPAVREALREVNALREHGATPDEVSAARDYLAGILPLELQTTEQLAARLADLAVFSLPDDYFQHYPARIAAVDADDVRRVANEHLRPDRLAIVVVGDAQRVAPELEALGLGPVEVHTIT